MVPIEASELRLGARFVFIGQRQFVTALNNAFGVDLDDGGPDHRTLRVLDQAPTLDPFLLREMLRREGLEPARCYFDLSAADGKRMFNFAQREIEPLVRLSMGGGEAAGVLTKKLTAKILANSGDAELDPLRRTLQLDEAQFQEGAFCWKAFLYYKWQLADLAPKVGGVLDEIRSIRPRDIQADEIKVYLAQARGRLCEALVSACRSARTTLGVYDSAYWNLVERNDPQAFREFLLNAPSLFNELGERLGAIEHILSFWRYRFPAGRPPAISGEELTDIFMDFESSLALDKGGPSILKPPTVLDLS